MKTFWNKILHTNSHWWISLFGGSLGVLIGTIYEKYLPMSVTLSLIVLVSVLIGLLLPPRL
jgi:hypothetical protein